MKIPKEALALRSAASTDPTRWMLGGVYFTRNSHLEAAATDGKQLTRLRWSKVAADDAPEFSTIIPTRECARLAKACSKETTELEIAEETNENPLLRSAFVNLANIPVEWIDGKYPDYSLVLDKTGGHDRTLLINPYILRDQLDTVCKTLGWTRAGKNQTHLVKIHFAQPDKKGRIDKPVVIEGKHGDLEVTGAVMPMVKD